MLQLTTWPSCVQVLGVEFPVVWADLGDDQGEMEYEPEPGGQIRIRIHQRFRDTDYAWLVLFHEITHAALAVSGTSELVRGENRGEEALVLSVEAVWRALVAAGKQSKKRVASRGSKGQATRTGSNSSRKRPSR